MWAHGGTTNTFWSSKLNVVKSIVLFAGRDLSRIGRTKKWNLELSNWIFLELSNLGFMQFKKDFFLNYQINYNELQFILNRFDSRQKLFYSDIMHYEIHFFMKKFSNWQKKLLVLF